MGCWNSKKSLRDDKPECKVIEINIPLDTKKPVGVPLVYNYIINRQELFFKEYIKQLYPYGVYNYPSGRC